MTALRMARDLDAGAVGAILSEFVDTSDWMPRIHTRAEDIAHAARMIDLGRVHVAEDNGKVVGFCARNGDDLDALYVASEKRGQGVGAALLRHAQTVVDRLELWTFQANEGAQRFYLRHGFVELQRTDGSGNDERLPDIQYEWQRETV
ncbi:GNAT family N-acetyltransferase [Sulfitobacter sp.]|uniref:GNAT family N-acetyltransferase n=1 Tax=Sulfitobacter sp. TaxID=1903071 RepID=UPI0039E37779